MLTQLASDVHVVGQVLAVPEQTNGAHVGVPVAPEGRVVHVPVAVAPSAVVQASHEPVQAALQQTPSAQYEDVHWSFAVQDPARADFATHCPLWQ